jgi:hypothetical protein
MVLIIIIFINKQRLSATIYHANNNKNPDFSALGFILNGFKGLSKVPKLCMLPYGTRTLSLKIGNGKLRTSAKTDFRGLRQLLQFGHPTTHLLGEHQKLSTIYGFP